MLLRIFVSMFNEEYWLVLLSLLNSPSVHAYFYLLRFSLQYVNRNYFVIMSESSNIWVICKSGFVLLVLWIVYFFSRSLHVSQFLTESETSYAGSMRGWNKYMYGQNDHTSFLSLRLCVCTCVWKCTIGFKFQQHEFVFRWGIGSWRLFPNAFVPPLALGYPVSLNFRVSLSCSCFSAVACYLVLDILVWEVGWGKFCFYVLTSVFGRLRAPGSWGWSFSVILSLPNIKDLW